jgi:hypothetical protein
VGGSHQAEHPEPARRRTTTGRGYTGLPRFGLIFAPALLSLVFLCVGALEGWVPVAVAVSGPQTVQLTVDKYFSDSTATFPGFYDTAAGEHRTVVPITLRNLRAQGVCVSTKVATPAGAYVLRVTSPTQGGEIRLGDVTFAVDTIDGIDFDADQVRLNYEKKTDAGVPVGTGPSEHVPLGVDKAVVNLNLTIRWATANQLRLSGLQLHGGIEQRECY